MSITSPPTAGVTFDNIIAITKLPGGFAKLTTSQRRLLITGILAAVLPADGKVLDVELQHYLGHLKGKFQFTAAEQKLAVDLMRKGISEEDLMQAARQLPDLLSADDRGNLIGLLWDVALSDHDLHAKEEQIIFKIADAAGVVRKRVIEEQARAARANGL